MSKRYLIAGSRTINLSVHQIAGALNLLSAQGLDIEPDRDVIISGGCPTGVDLAAKKFALEYGIEYREYPADWETHGKSAGPIRNFEMGLEADALILIWDGESRGSASMRGIMKRFARPIFELIIPARSGKV